MKIIEKEGLVTVKFCCRALWRNFGYYKFDPSTNTNHVWILHKGDNEYTPWLHHCPFCGAKIVRQAFLDISKGSPECKKCKDREEKKKRWWQR